MTNTGAAYSPITTEHNWFCGEKKIFRFVMDPVIDISNWEMKWQVRVDEPDADALITKITGEGITIADGPAGVFEVTVDADDTVNLDPGRYAHAAMRTEDALEGIVAYGPAVLQLSAVRKE